MALVLIVVVLLLLFGGGGFYRYRSGHYGGRGFGGILGLLVLPAVLYLVFGGGLGGVRGLPALPHRGRWLPWRWRGSGGACRFCGRSRRPARVRHAIIRVAPARPVTRTAPGDPETRRRSA
jgi:hypothetical protein